MGVSVGTLISLSVRLCPDPPGERSGLFSFLLTVSKRAKLLLASCWLNGRLALGRSTIGRLDGSYASLFSKANMLLFLTLLAWNRRSTLGRRLGEDDGEDSWSGVFSLSKRVGDIGSRPAQKSRGDALAKEGGDEFSV